MSSLEGAVSPPSVIIGSSTVKVVELIVVVVPFTVKLPAIVSVVKFPVVKLASFHFTRSTYFTFIIGSRY